MKNCIAAVLTAVVGIAGFAATNDNAAVTNDEIQELRRTGGRIYKVNSQKGKIVYVDCQSAADEKWVRESADYAAEITKFNVGYAKGRFSFPSPKVEGTRSLFLVDDATLPKLMTAPEDGWVVVNVAHLKTEKAAFFEARVRKELSRGLAYLCGAEISQFKGTLLEGVKGAEDLDQHMDFKLPLDVVARFQRAMRPFGITPARYTAYINACRQGWAPPPTNDYQKAIWDQVHEIPTNPIKIKYDPKTGK